MKLLAHYNRVNLLTTVIVLVITGIIYYAAISYILNNQVDKDIRTEETETLDYVKKYGRLPPVVDYKDQQVQYAPTGQPVERHFVNTGFYNKKCREYESGRGLITPVTVNGQNYQVTITESKVETEDLIRIVFGITIGVVLFLLLVLFLTNRFVLNRLWKPFYAMLAQLKVFNLSDSRDIAPPPSNIDEFNELNTAVAQMATRVKTDYSDLKAFTENASHELLTPIAVINSKLDSLLQTGEYNELQSHLLNDVYGAVSRLTRLNQSLLLLVKIENGLLKDEQLIDMKALISEKVAEFKELFADKRLTITCRLDSIQLTISRYLADILLNNLLSNAMRHNHHSGQIIITLTSDSIVIENTGSEVSIPEANLFKRFSKSPESEGTGLGLTLCKQICDNYHYRLSYNYQQPYHTFTVSFNLI